MWGDPHKKELPESMLRIFPSERSERIWNVVMVMALVIIVAMTAVDFFNDFSLVAKRQNLNDFTTMAAERGQEQPRTSLIISARSMMAEWSHVDGGNLRDDGVTDDIAEWLNAIYNDGPARRKLHKQLPLRGPYREKFCLLIKYGLVNETKCGEFLNGY